MAESNHSTSPGRPVAFGQGDGEHRAGHHYTGKRDDHDAGQDREHRNTFLGSSIYAPIVAYLFLVLLEFTTLMNYTLA